MASALGLNDNFDDEVESIFMRGWHQFLYETYGI